MIYQNGTDRYVKVSTGINKVGGCGASRTRVREYESAPDLNLNSDAESPYRRPDVDRPRRFVKRVDERADPEPTHSKPRGRAEAEGLRLVRGSQIERQSRDRAHRKSDQHTIPQRVRSPDGDVVYLFLQNDVW